MATNVTRTGAVLLTMALALSGLHARELSFDQRVSAQRSIERVYFAHQVDSNRTFEDAVPKSVLEQKVRNTLRQGAALETIWKTPITAEMLEAELARMAAGSRMPERLRELFEALGNDSFLIQECLARPALADRLSRNFFASDEVLHQDARREAESLRTAIVAGTLEAARPHARRSIVARTDSSHRWLGGVEPLVEDAEAFSFRVELDQAAPGAAELATYSVPKTTWDEWWSGASLDLNGELSVPVASESFPLPRIGLRDGGRAPAAPAELTSCALNDTWDNRRLGAPSEARSEHTAVWTGSLMIVWGGKDELSFPASGGRYDPATDTWTSTSLVNAPTPRTGHTAVWTGSRMIVFGGYETVSQGTTVYPDGAMYDPVADAWQPIAPFPTRAYHTAVWTGTRMIVWGGGKTTAGSFETLGGLYDPVTNTWTQVNPTGAPSNRFRHTAVWTPLGMIVWGGHTNAASDTNAVNTGGLYDPASDSWTSTTTNAAPSARGKHTAVWAGDRMVVWGGGSPSTNTGGRYDPATNSWTSTSVSNAPLGRIGHSAISTGSRMIVWGGWIFNIPTNTGSGYDPQSDTWFPMSSTNAPTPRLAHSAVWTGSRMIVWGGALTIGGGPMNSGGRYDPASDSWTPTANASAPRARGGATAVWTGNQMIVWGGGVITNMQTVLAPGLQTGGRYDPTLDTWTPTRLLNGPSPTPSEAAPSARLYHSAVWTGDRMIVWGGAGSANPNLPVLATGAMYDPIRDSWVSTPPGPSARCLHAAVWTGSHMLIWGGEDPAISGTGSRFDPVSLTWAPISTTGAPFDTGDIQVWTGSRLIVWSNFFGGNRYDPLADGWTPMSSVNAPGNIAVGLYAGAWAGNRFVVWGASDPGTGLITSGGRYDPGTDTWASIATGGPATDSVKTVSTGGRMLLWGGSGGANYDVAADAWSPISQTGAPSPRYLHAAVWTGSSLLVWGGLALDASLQSALNDGGRYLGAYPDDFDGDGQTGCDGDCDDRRADIYAGAAELCDGLDNNCDGIVPANERDADLDGFTGCSGDCNDASSAIHPGAPELCNGIDDDCDSVVPANEADADGDGARVCSGDCNDANAAIRPGAIEQCNGFDDNCDTVVPANEADADGDGVRVCGGDCNDAAASVYPHALEVNDGLDNQCPGDADYGIVDEISGVSGYFTTSDDVFSWPAQSGATSYEIARSPYPDFHAGCVHSTTFSTSFADSTRPPAGGSFFYLVRASTPHLGSWGQRTVPGDRVVCAGCVSTGDWCDDGTACTVGESCTGTVCGGATPLLCDDGNPCTNDSCDAALGCIHVNNTNACDDGTACTTGDVCGGGACVGAPLDCDDGNVCTTDSCHSVSGCAHVNNTIACDDGVGCTNNDTCQGGVCVGRVPGVANHLVISQIQNSGGTTDDEFIELYNPTLAPISVVGLSIQYKANPGSTWAVHVLGGSGVTTVPARGWFLVARAGYDGAVAADEIVTSFSLPETGGSHVLLVNGTAAQTTSCPSGGAIIIDKVGMGGSANCSETSPASSPGANNSILRLPGGSCGNGTDSNANSADFVSEAPSNPRNHLSPHRP